MVPGKNEKGDLGSGEVLARELFHLPEETPGCHQETRVIIEREEGVHRETTGQFSPKNCLNVTIQSVSPLAAPKVG